MWTYELDDMPLYCIVAHFVYRDCCKKEVSLAARNDEDADKLWKLSEEWTGLQINPAVSTADTKIDDGVSTGSEAP